jgi:hypothetical protein
MWVRALAVASGAGWALLAVRPEDTGCSGPSLRWVLLEPLAEALRLKPLFQDGGPLAALVLLAPLLGLALGGLTVVASRREGGRWARMLGLGAGLGLLGAGLWALLLQLAWLS